jgi:hypothetical protein
MLLGTNIAARRRDTMEILAKGKAWRCSGAVLEEQEVAGRERSMGVGRGNWGR